MQSWKAEKSKSPIQCHSQDFCPKGAFVFEGGTAFEFSHGWLGLQKPSRRQVSSTCHFQVSCVPRAGPKGAGQIQVGAEPHTLLTTGLVQ